VLWGCSYRTPSASCEAVKPRISRTVSFRRLRQQESFDMSFTLSRIAITERVIRSPRGSHCRFSPFSISVTSQRKPPTIRPFTWTRCEVCRRFRPALIWCATTRVCSFGTENSGEFVGQSCAGTVSPGCFLEILSEAGFEEAALLGTTGLSYVAGETPNPHLSWKDSPQIILEAARLARRNDYPS
jgi:hypothetical protein